jgi:hypothetical protein
MPGKVNAPAPPCGEQGEGNHAGAMPIIAAAPRWSKITVRRNQGTKK